MQSFDACVQMSRLLSVAYTYICIYVYMYICIYVYMYICVYAYMYICIYVCTPVYICMYTCYICMYMYMYIYVCIHRKGMPILSSAVQCRASSGFRHNLTHVNVRSRKRIRPSTLTHTYSLLHLECRFSVLKSQSMI